MIWLRQWPAWWPTQNESNKTHSTGQIRSPKKYCCNILTSLVLWGSQTSSDRKRDFSQYEVEAQEEKGGRTYHLAVFLVSLLMPLPRPSLRAEAIHSFNNRSLIWPLGNVLARSPIKPKAPRMIVSLRSSSSSARWEKARMFWTWGRSKPGWERCVRDERLSAKDQWKEQTLVFSS